jgi:hypothetical protein
MTASIYCVLDTVRARPERDFFLIGAAARQDALEIEDGQAWSVHRRSGPELA